MASGESLLQNPLIVLAAIQVAEEVRVFVGADGITAPARLTSGAR